MKQTRWILLMILLLGMTGLACSSFLGGGEEDTAVGEAEQNVPTVAAVAEVPDSPPTPTAAAASQEAAAVSEAAGAPAENGADAGGDTAVSDSMPATFSLNAANQYGELAGVNSYRTSMEFRFTAEGADGSQTVGVIRGEGARVVDPPAMTLNFTAEGAADFDGGQNVSLTQIGAANYFILPNGQCVSLGGGDEENLYSVLLDAGGMLGDLEGAELVEQGVEINGVTTDHYRFDETNLNPNDPETEQVTAATGDIYVASDGQYVVRLMMSGWGANSLLSGSDGEGEIYYELNYYDFNQPLEITPPENCPETAAPDDYPILDDATNMNAIAGLFTYETAQSFETVLDFYKAEMAAAGWTLAQEVSQPPAATLTFTGAGGTVQVNLGPAPGGSGVLVAIVELP